MDNKLLKKEKQKEKDIFLFGGYLILLFSVILLMSTLAPYLIYFE